MCAIHHTKKEIYSHEKGDLVIHEGEGVERKIELEVVERSASHIVSVFELVGDLNRSYQTGGSRRGDEVIKSYLRVSSCSGKFHIYSADLLRILINSEKSREILIRFLQFTKNFQRFDEIRLNIPHKQKKKIQKCVCIV